MSSNSTSHDRESSEYIQIGFPIVIGGSEVVVVRDSIGARLAKDPNGVVNQVLPAGSDGRPAIFIDEADISAMRNSYPGVKVYGLWQILFENGRVKLGSEVVIGQTRRVGGNYIRMRPESDFSDAGNILESGEYIGERIASLKNFDLNEAIKVDLAVLGLKLPSKPAYSRRELYEQFEGQKRRRWINVAGICALIVLATGVYNFQRYNAFNQEASSFKSKKAELDKMTVAFNELKSTRIEHQPNDSIPLGILKGLSMLDPGLKTAPATEKAASSFAQGQSHSLISSPAFPVDPGKVVPGITTQRNQLLQYEIKINQAGGGK